MKFYPLEKIANLHEQYRKSFQVDNHYLLLLQNNNQQYLIESHCPHAGYPMIDSKLIGKELRCPMHGYLFDVETGECTLAIEGPCRGLKTYLITYQNDYLGVEL